MSRSNRLSPWNASRLPRRRALWSAATVLLFLPWAAVVPLAGAYSVSDTTFADGSTSATVDVLLGQNSSMGPSLRLLTNASFIGASVSVGGQQLTANASREWNSTADFQGGTRLTNVVAASGSLTLESHSDLHPYDATNGFGNGTHTGTTIAAGRLVLSGGTSGSYQTPPAASNSRGWGMFFANGATPAGTSLSFRLLDANGSVLAASIEPGARIPFDSVNFPSMSIEVLFTSPSAGVSPS